MSLTAVAKETGLEPELIERILIILGTPKGRQRNLSPEDVAALRHCARALAAGFPLVAFLQLVRVYVQSMRRIADAEVRLFHLYVHEPLIRDAVPELEMAVEMGDLAADIMPLAAPLTEYLHNRYLRFFLEQDVVGHMEAGLEANTAEIELGQVTVTLCFIDLTGFTRYTEEEGDMEALDVIENFVETVEATLPREATIVKTIGDEVMVVSPDAASLTEWAVEFLRRFPKRPQPRVGIHCGEAVYRDGDYFGSQVNLAHRVVNRALAGEVLVTDRVAGAIEAREQLELEAIGQVSLKGFPVPTDLFVVRAAS
jgi:adenylate cyclase